MSFQVDSVSAVNYTCYVSDSNYCIGFKKFKITEPDPVNTLTSVNGATLMALSDADSYEWIDCDNGNKHLLGGKNKEFKATKNGNYAVIVILGDCSDTSSCINISSLGIKNYSSLNYLDIFPIPTKDLCAIKSSSQICLEATFYQLFPSPMKPLLI